MTRGSRMPGDLADVVDGPDGDVAHPEVVVVELHEQVVWEAVARVEPVELEDRERLGV